MNLDVILAEEAHAPCRATTFSAGLDLRAMANGVVFPGTSTLVDTGVIARLPPGHCGLICSRSGLALKHDIAVLNAPGIIDEDYRGKIGVILFNHGQTAFYFSAGDRIAQLLIMPVAYAGVRVVHDDELGSTERGAGGFGHTGS